MFTDIICLVKTVLTAVGYFFCSTTLVIFFYKSDFELGPFSLWLFVLFSESRERDRVKEKLCLALNIH